MIPDTERTIFALASGARGARRAIVRLTGPRTAEVMAEVLQLPRDSGILATSHLTTQVCALRLPELAHPLPVRLLYWPDQRSYTGQPSAELHVIGSLPIVEALMARCAAAGAVMAERGEFTLRAFLSGKIDLSQAEAVLGVIEASSTDQLHTALQQLGGNLAPAIGPLKAQLLEVVAELEAGLDFVDEDIEFITQDSLISQLEQVHQALEDFSHRLITRSSSNLAPRVVLVGLPNSGKSSLFNAICGEAAAIVTDQPGTTRDFLQRRVRMGLVDVDLIDTAGWEELIETGPRAMAQDQLRACLRSAELAVLCIDSTQVSGCELLHQAWKRLQPLSPRWMVVATKLDLPAANVTAVQQLARELLGLETSRTAARQLADWEVSATSSVSHLGLEALSERIAQRLSVSSVSNDSVTLVHQTATRCRASLDCALEALVAASNAARISAGDEFVAAELRLALDSLATIIGEVHSDDILGEIFSKFCIGK